MDINKESVRVEKFFNEEISPVLSHLRWLLNAADIPFVFAAQVNGNEVEVVVSMPPAGYRKIRFDIEGSGATVTMYPTEGKKWEARQYPPLIKPYLPNISFE